MSDLDDIKQLVELKQQEKSDKEKESQENIRQENLQKAKAIQEATQNVVDFHKRVLELKEELKTEVKIIVSKHESTPTFLSESKYMVIVYLGSANIIREPYEIFYYSGDVDVENEVNQIKESVATMLAEGYSYKSPEWAETLYTNTIQVISFILGLMVWFYIGEAYGTWGFALGLIACYFVYTLGIVHFHILIILFILFVVYVRVT